MDGRFSGEPMLPSNVTPNVGAAALVDLTFASRPLKLVIQVWTDHVLYVRLNATGASPTAGKVFRVTALQPLVLRDVALDGAVALSIWNAGATAFVWDGTGQNGAVLAW